MRHKFVFACAMLALVATPALAQMGGGMGGGGMGGGRRGQHRGQGQDESTSGKAPAGPNRPVPQQLPVDMRLSGVINIIGENKAADGGTVSSEKPDVSAIYISRGGSLALKNAVLTTSGAVSLLDDSRGSGLNSALLLNQASRSVMTGGRIDTSGLGANAAYASGPGTQLELDGVTLSTRASNAYGIEASDGAVLRATGVTVSTLGDQAPAIASHRAAPMQLSGLTLHTAASNSPLLLAEGDMTVSNAKGEAERDNGLAVSGAHHVQLQTPDFKADGYAIAVSASSPPGLRAGGAPHAPGAAMGPDMPDASDAADDPDKGKVTPAEALLSPAPDAGRRAEIKIDGGALSGDRAVMLVSNGSAHIVLTGVSLASDSHVILKSAAGQGGEVGRNGGDADLELHGETVTGDFVTDVISSIRVSLLDQSHLTGKATPNTDITLDAGSDWTLPEDTHVGKLVVSGLDTPDAIANIKSGGHTLYYDPHRNPWLDHKTWPLPGGGQLTPDV